MSDIGTVKSSIQAIPVLAVNKDPAKKQQSKKKKGKDLPEQGKGNSEVHVNEYI
jgi:hypothetical protein